MAVFPLDTVACGTPAAERSTAEAPPLPCGAPVAALPAPAGATACEDEGEGVIGVGADCAAEGTAGAATSHAASHPAAIRSRVARRPLHRPPRSFIERCPRNRRAPHPLLITAPPTARAGRCPRAWCGRPGPRCRPRGRRPAATAAP